VNRYLLTRDIVGGYDLGATDPNLEDYLLLACTEMTTRQDIDDLVATLETLQPEEHAADHIPATVGTGGAE
jgi:glycine cleavage system pyridoxal-binding protein P